jgi:hypothetical protein
MRLCLIGCDAMRWDEAYLIGGLRRRQFDLWCSLMHDPVPVAFTRLYRVWCK